MSPWQSLRRLPFSRWGSDAESVYDEDTESYYEEQNELKVRDRNEFLKLGSDYDSSTVECADKRDDAFSAHVFKYPIDSVSYNASRAATIEEGCKCT